MSTVKTIQLTPIADLKPYLNEQELVALNLGSDLQLYAVVALKKLDYRFKSEAGASFAKTTPDSPQTYRVLAFRNNIVTLDLLIEEEKFNIHDVQPLPNNELLLVCGRSYFRSEEDFDKNGRIYSSSGKFVREILLGDGIQNVQTTSAGLIWTSFFDEGIFGNFGWSNPIGGMGLLAWNSHGQQQYEFKPTDGLGYIYDCYAMNVASDSSTWLYYYTQFPLVHLRNKRIESHWDVPISGSNAFAVSNGYALFAGGYGNRDEYHLFELGDGGSINEVAKFTLANQDDAPLVAASVFSRSNTLCIEHNLKVYQLTIEDALASLA